MAEANTKANSDIKTKAIMTKQKDIINTTNLKTVETNIKNQEIVGAVEVEITLQKTVRHRHDEKKVIKIENANFQTTKAI